MSDYSRIIISWLGLRKLLGIVGILHPVVLYAGGVLVFHTDLQNSMSAYYYTGMRDVFVGLGFVLGFFLLAYNGYDTHDRIVSAIAGLAALSVALFPTTPEHNPSAHEILIGNIHVASAFVFLLAISYFCLVLFPKSGGGILSAQKRTRNSIYRACGIIILLSLSFVGAYFTSPYLHTLLEAYHPVFFSELIAFWAFGFAWLVKGQALLAD